MSGIGTTDALLVISGMGLIATWLVMLPIALWSVIAEPTGKARGMAWATAIIALPFLGAIAFWTRNRWQPSTRPTL